MKHHAIPKSFQCARCDAYFNTAVKLKAHISDEHMKTEPINCDQCGDSFEDETIFKRHVKKHLAEDLFQCEKCGKTFKFWVGLKSHEKDHSNENNNQFSCNICGMSFTICSALQKHILTVHSDLKAKMKKSSKTNVQRNAAKIHPVDTLNTRANLAETVIKMADTKNTSGVSTSIGTSKRQKAMTYWCHPCKCEFVKAADFRSHIVHKHQNLSDESDSDADEPLNSSLNTNKFSDKNMSIKYKGSFSKRKREKSMKKLRHAERSASHSSKDPQLPDNTPSIQVPLNSSSGNQLPYRLGQIQQPVTNNFSQPVQFQQPFNGFTNVAQTQNVQPQPVQFQQPSFINVGAQSQPIFHTQGPSDCVPKFDFSSIDYVRWLSEFTKMCKTQNFPLQRRVVQQMSQVYSDIFNALSHPTGSLRAKSNHASLFRCHKTLSQVMKQHVQHKLMPEINWSSME